MEKEKEMGGLCFPLCLWHIWCSPDLPQWPVVGKGIQPGHWPEPRPERARAWPRIHSCPVTFPTRTSQAFPPWEGVACGHSAWRGQRGCRRLCPGELKWVQGGSQLGLWGLSRFQKGQGMKWC